MKSVNHLNLNALSNEALRQTKGGNKVTTVTFETMVEVTTTNSAGGTEMLYCDRRRKKVDC